MRTIRKHPATVFTAMAESIIKCLSVQKVFLPFLSPWSCTSTARPYRSRVCPEEDASSAFNSRIVSLGAGAASRHNVLFADKVLLEARVMEEFLGQEKLVTETTEYSDIVL